MKKNFICMYLFLLATLASCQSCSSDYKDVDDIVVEGVETPVPFGRPVHHVARWHLLCLWHPCG